MDLAERLTLNSLFMCSITAPVLLLSGILFSLVYMMGAWWIWGLTCCSLWCIMFKCLHSYYVRKTVLMSFWITKPFVGGFLMKIYTTVQLWFQQDTFSCPLQTGLKCWFDVCARAACGETKDQNLVYLSSFFDAQKDFHLKTALSLTLKWRT